MRSMSSGRTDGAGRRPHMREAASAQSSACLVGSLKRQRSSYSYVTRSRAEHVDARARAQSRAEIRVNAVLPGLIETRWLKDGLGEKPTGVCRWLADAAALARPHGRDVAQTIVWLIADAALVTGQC